MMRFLIDTRERNNFNISTIKRLIISLFKGTDIEELKITLYKDKFFFYVKDICNRKVTHTRYPYNIKNKSTLGYYCVSVNIMLIPVKNNSFRGKLGRGTNRPIRGLFDIEK